MAIIEKIDYRLDAGQVPDDRVYIWIQTREVFDKKLRGIILQ